MVPVILLMPGERREESVGVSGRAQGNIQIQIIQRGSVQRVGDLCRALTQNDLISKVAEKQTLSSESVTSFSELECGKYSLTLTQ